MITISSEDLHFAADVCGRFGDDESRIGEYGLAVDQLARFVEEADWRTPGDDHVPVSPTSLALGVSIGVIAVYHHAGSGANSYDPEELIRWADTYGHPEDWAKTAMDTCRRAEKAEAEVQRLRVLLDALKVDIS